MGLRVGAMAAALGCGERKTFVSAADGDSLSAFTFFA
jgi:hypothetical protein